MVVEEIVISTRSAAPADTWDGTEKERIAVLEQRSSSGRKKYRFELLNNQILSVSIEQVRRKTRTFEIYPCMLDPEPHRLLSVSWRHLAVFLGFSLAAGLAGSSGYTPYPFILTAGLAVFAGLALAASNPHFQHVYRSRNGRIPLVSFLSRKPDHRTFNNFIDTLEKHIGNTDCLNEIADADEALNTELREHRRLMESGIISVKSYEKAKSRILGKHR
jgi:hypothetical protein